MHQLCRFMPPHSPVRWPLLLLLAVTTPVTCLGAPVRKADNGFFQPPKSTTIGASGSFSTKNSARLTQTPSSGYSFKTSTYEASQAHANQYRALSGLTALSRIGPMSLEQRNDSPIPDEQGTTVTAAYPVKRVPGMDMVVNVFGGHRETMTGSNAASGAITAGVRFKW